MNRFEGANQSKLMPVLLVSILLGTIAGTGRRAAAQDVGATASNIFSRRYSLGETLLYRMSGRNQDSRGLRVYTATASGTVTSNSSGLSVVPFSWSDLVWNGEALPLSPADATMRETLSLDPRYKLTVPDLSKVNPKLIGPITDLLTFYADLQLADRHTELKKPGDHVFFKYAGSNSWADGQYVLIGQDAIDFDITLKSIDPRRRPRPSWCGTSPPIRFASSFPRSGCAHQSATPPITGSRSSGREQTTSMSKWDKRRSTSNSP
jgi:hypothetical protein